MKRTDRMQNDKKCRICESGVSETIGAVLLIALVVTAIAIVGVMLSSQPLPQKIPALDSVISTYGNTIQITHNGGDMLQKEDMMILVNGVDQTSSFLKEGSPSWQTWTTGESLILPDNVNPDNVKIVFKNAQTTTLLSSANFGNVGNVTAQYKIAVSSGSGGTITPAGPDVPAYYHDMKSFTILPYPGYHIVNVLVDGNSVGAVSSYTIGPVIKDYTISATFAINTYTITPSAGANGAISPNTPQTVNEGSSQGFTITPNPHYHIANVLVDGVSNGTNSSYTFTNVVANHTIDASFAFDTFTITASAGANGAIDPSGTVSVNSGATQTFNITPNTGYHIADVKVDNVSSGTISSYTFTDVAANHTITSSFAIDTFTLTPFAGAGGAISPGTPQTVNYGGYLNFTIIPDANYHITNVTVDGTSVGTPSSYNFTNVQASHTINASFAIDTYTITATNDTFGAVTPAGITTVNYGATPTYTITPNTGYHVQDVLVNGTSVGAVTSYLFPSVTTNKTISATFAINTYTITATNDTFGAVTPAGITTVNYGATPTYTITPNTGYHVQDVLVNGTSVGAVTSYLFPSVTTNKTISATFAINTYTITATNDTFGAVTPAGITTVNYGATPTYTITPNTGYHVQDVLVNGTSVGAVTSYLFPSVTTNKTISATFAINTYTITASSGANGDVTPTGITTVNYGATPTYTITPNTGYHVQDVLVNGTSVGAVTSYLFPSVTTNKTISATFAINTYTITASSGANGDVTPTGITTVNYGATPTYTITPNTGYHVQDVLVNGTSVGAVTSYLFPSVTTNKTISATFAINTYTITATNDTFGAVIPAGITTVNYGATPTYTITPNTGYHVQDVLVNGTSVGAVTSYLFPSVTTNKTISATFAINTYTITATNDTFGAVTPAGITTVNYGATPTYTITPNTGYHVQDVLVNGTSVGAVTSYLFPNVTTNKTISATFAINTYTITPSIIGGNGAVSPATPLTVNYGATPIFNFTPNTGYHLFNVTVNGTAVTPSGNSYTFPAVTTNKTIVGSFAIDTFTITPSIVGGNGAISPATPLTVNYGATSIFNFTPNTGYHLFNVTVNGTAVTPTGNSYTFPAVTTNKTIVGSFAIDTFTITPSIVGGNGAVSPATPLTVNYGATPIFNFTPNTGYHLFNVTVNGTAVTPSGNSYTFPAVTTNKTIVGSFAIDTFTITPSIVGGNGAISPATVQTVNYGDTPIFNFTPNTGYHLFNVTINGTAVTPAGNSYTFPAVTTNKTIIGSFTINTYTITATNDTFGAVTPAGVTTVNYGDTPTYTITPNTGYHVQDVLVNGTSVGTVTSYLFPSVTTNKTISATFAINTYTITPSILRANGTVSPATVQTVNYGATPIFNFTPATGYHLDTVTVNGTAVTPIGNSYTFPAVTTNKTLVGTFLINPPIPEFTGSPRPGAIPLNVTFTDLSTNSPTSWLWNFGDGQYSTLQNPTNTYSSAGNYSVRLEVANEGGSNATEKAGYVFTYIPAVANFTNSTGYPRTGPASLTVYFTDLSTGSPINFLWHFGDIAIVNTSTMQNPGHTYDTIGLYSVNLTVANPYSSSSLVRTGYINVTTPIPEVYIFPNTTSGYAPLPVLLEGLASNSPTSWLWHFGDGTSDVTTMDTTHTFVNPGSYNVSLTATNAGGSGVAYQTITVNALSITASLGANGAVTPAGVTTVNYGATPTYTITPNTGYHVADVLVNGTSVGAVTSYVFPPVTINKTISATFDINTYTITATNDTFGAVTPAGVTTVNYGATPTFTFTANTGYHLNNVTVNGTLVTPTGNSYTFPSIATNKTISATFAPNTYTITPSINGGNGAVSPATVQTVNYGGTPTFTFTPNTGYYLDNVTVNGTLVTPTGNTYTFPAVTTNKTIVGMFGINTYTITASVAAGNGTISPAGVTTVNYGATPTYIITKNASYHIQDVLVNGTSVGAVASYVFPSVATDKTIAASFERNPRGQMFYEDFNAAFTGWTVSGASRQTGTVPKNGTASVRMRSNNQYMYKTFSTAGDMDIVVQFAWATTLTASGEYARAEYSTNGGTSWTTLSQINGPVTQTTLSIFTSPVLPAAADNNTNFRLRFIIMGSNNSDLLYVDDVKITGIPI
jgi:PKD repeat protein